jgi:5'(3')-deoxyribonucleotidase
MDFLIDDGPHNIEAFDGTGILLDMPWNQHVERVHIRITRDNTWLQIKRLFQDILEGKDRWASRNITIDRRD